MCFNILIVHHDSTTKIKVRSFSLLVIVMSATDITLREVSSGQISPRVKNPPKQGSKGISVPFVYTPSDDGTDENLLILLHGLGE